MDNIEMEDLEREDSAEDPGEPQEPLADIPQEDLIVALEEPTVASRLEAVRTLLNRHRVRVSASNDEAWNQPSTSQTPKPDNPALVAFLARVEAASIANPAEQRELAKSTIEYRLNEMNLCEQFNQNSELFLRFIYHQINDRKVAESTWQKYVLHSSRILAYTFRKLKLELEKINDPAILADCLCSEWVRDYIDKALKCNISAAELRLITESVKAMINFVLLSDWSKQKVSMKQVVRLRMQRQTIDYFIGPLKEAKMREEERRKRFKTSRRHHPQTFADIRAMFRYATTRRQLQKLKDLLNRQSLRAKDITEDMYNFLIQYCHAVVSIYYGKRPQVASCMLVKEFVDRERIEIGEDNEDVEGDQPACIIRVGNVKTKKSHGPEEVFLTKNEEFWFSLYFELRKKLKPTYNDDEPLFIGFNSRAGLTNSSRIVRDFQAAVGFTPRLLHQQIRHIIETASSEHFRNDERKRNAIARMLAHTTATAIRSYVDEAVANLSIQDCAMIMLELEDITRGGQRIIDEALFREDEPEEEGDEADRVFPNTPAVRQFLIKIGLTEMTSSSEIPTRNQIVDEEYLFETDDSLEERRRKADILYRSLYNDLIKHRIDEVIETVLGRYLKLGNDDEVQELTAGDYQVERDLERLLTEELASRGWVLGNARKRLIPKAMKALKKHFPAPTTDSSQRVIDESDDDDDIDFFEEQPAAATASQSQQSVEHLGTIVRSQRVESLLDRLFGSQEREDEEEGDEAATYHYEEEEEEAFELSERSLEAEHGLEEEDEAGPSGGQEGEQEEQAGPSRVLVLQRRKPTKAENEAAFKKVYTEEELVQRCRDQKWPHLEVQEFPVRGLGVVAGHDIAANQIICDYAGQLVETSELAQELDILSQQKKDENLPAEERDRAGARFRMIDSYRLDIPPREMAGRGYSIDASADDQSYGRRMNHTPNTSHGNVTMDVIPTMESDGTVKPRVFIKTTKFVRAGDELIWNYGSSEYKKEKWKCPCYRAGCRREWDKMLDAIEKSGIVPEESSEEEEEEEEEEDEEQQLQQQQQRQAAPAHVLRGHERESRSHSRPADAASSRQQQDREEEEAEKSSQVKRPKGSSSCAPKHQAATRRRDSSNSDEEEERSADAASTYRSRHGAPTGGAATMPKSGESRRTSSSKKPRQSSTYSCAEDKEPECAVKNEAKQDDGEIVLKYCHKETPAAQAAIKRQEEPKWQIEQRQKHSLTVIQEGEEEPRPPAEQKSIGSQVQNHPAVFRLGAVRSAAHQQQPEGCRARSKIEQEEEKRRRYEREKEQRRKLERTKKAADAAEHRRHEQNQECEARWRAEIRMLEETNRQEGTVTESSDSRKDSSTATTKENFFERCCRKAKERRARKAQRREEEQREYEEACVARYRQNGGLRREVLHRAAQRRMMQGEAAQSVHSNRSEMNKGLLQPRALENRANREGYDSVLEGRLQQQQKKRGTHLHQQQQSEARELRMRAAEQRRWQYQLEQQERGEEEKKQQQELVKRRVRFKETIPQGHHHQSEQQQQPQQQQQKRRMLMLREQVLNATRTVLSLGGHNRQRAALDQEPLILSEDTATMRWYRQRVDLERERRQDFVRRQRIAHFSQRPESPPLQQLQQEQRRQEQQRRQHHWADSLSGSINYWDNLESENRQQMHIREMREPFLNRVERQQRTRVSFWPNGSSVVSILASVAERTTFCVTTNRTMSQPEVASQRGSLATATTPKPTQGQMSPLTSITNQSVQRPPPSPKVALARPRIAVSRERPTLYLRPEMASVAPSSPMARVQAPQPVLEPRLERVQQNQLVWNRDVGRSRTSLDSGYRSLFDGAGAAAGDDDDCCCRK